VHAALDGQQVRPSQDIMCLLCPAALCNGAAPAAEVAASSKAQQYANLVAHGEAQRGVNTSQKARTRRCGFQLPVTSGGHCLEDLSYAT
jgi:curli biogenesis system outer membrane secretion channel CsgG